MTERIIHWGKAENSPGYAVHRRVACGLLMTTDEWNKSTTGQNEHLVTCPKCRRAIGAPPLGVEFGAAWMDAHPPQRHAMPMHWPDPGRIWTLCGLPLEDERTFWIDQSQAPAVKALDVVTCTSCRAALGNAPLGDLAYSQPPPAEPAIPADWPNPTPRYTNEEPF